MPECQKCHQRTFTRQAYSYQGWAWEVYCPCGWSKPVAVAGPDGEFRSPATAEDFRELGYHKQAVSAGRLGGLATRSEERRVGKECRL